MTKRKNKLNYILKVTKKGKVVDRYQTRSKRRFYNRVSTIKWQTDHPSVYIRVGYGRLLSNRNKLEQFWNDGDYDNKKDLMLALNAFVED